MQRPLQLPPWARALLAFILLSLLRSLPDTPTWLWYGKRAAYIVILIWAVCEVVVAWREYGRVQKESEPSEEYYLSIRLSWPMVAAIGFGLICVLLLVTQLLGGR